MKKLKKLKIRILKFFPILLSALMLSACGEDPELTRFRKSIDDFCTRISEIDSDINHVDPEADNAVSQLLGYLDDLDIIFQTFAALDFPEEFDYLEELADDASEYMTEAVKSYHEAYGGDSYNAQMAEYAKQNYSRSYKRIQIIITFLHGEEPDDADLSIEYNSR